MNGLLKTTYREFFPKRYGGNIMSDYNCEIPNNCDGNSALFKGVTADWMAMMTTIMPDLKQQILPKLKASAVAAADQCSGGSNGDTCGSRWYQKGKYDGTSGIGQEMSSLSVLASSLIGEKEDAGPKSAKTGGKSKPNPNAGTGDRSSDPGAELSDITTGDKAGAGILTVVFVVGWIGAMTWMLWDR